MQVRVRADDVAEFLDSPVRGGNPWIYHARSIDSLETGCVLFVSRWSEEFQQRLAHRDDLLALVPESCEDECGCPHIVTPNPRLAFAYVLQKFFSDAKSPCIAVTARVASSSQIGLDVSIGECCVIGDNVAIGDRTVIHHHVVIADNTVIGHDCLIRSNTVIGEEGFGFAFDKEKQPVRLPHLGSVELGNYVEIGALNTIARGTLDKTIIGDFVKTDDHVHIAHNVRIGKNTLITACAEISGSVTIGENAWIGPNAAIMDKVGIGSDSLVGLGAVVTRPVGENLVVFGNPAKRVRTRHSVAS